MTSDPFGTLHQVLWIGGAPWSGKSTVARLLAARHGLTAYHHDAPAEGTAEELLNRTAAGFSALLAELRSLHSPRPVVAEGWALRPELVAPLVDSPRRMVVLVPTEVFRQHQLRHLADGPAIPRQRGRLTRDRILAAAAGRSARERGIRVLEIDGRLGPEAVTDVVADHFKEFLDA